MGEKRCLIIAPLYQGEERDLLTPGEDDLLICADGGYRAAKKWGMNPGLVIGDFDSLGYVPNEGEVIRLPVEKDDTDLVVCIAEGRRRGYRSFVAAGCLGGRFDHTLSALQCAADCAMRGERLWLCDSMNRVTVLAPGQHEIQQYPGRKLSLLAYSERVSGVCLKGTAWELEDAELTSRWPLGCSNEWCADVAELSFTQGLLVLSISGDPAQNTNDR